MNLVHNAYLDNLGQDFVAIDANGHPIARAATEAAVRQAAPDAAEYHTAESLGLAPPPDHPPPAPEADEPGEIATQTFDHDGKDGPGGSLKGEQSTAHKGATKKAATKK